MSYRHFTIQGVKVSFPFDPYPSQMAMMTKIIQGLKRGQSCLLDSPTGSGKSLALLCAALAWQRSESERVEAHNKAVDEARANSVKAMSRQDEQQYTTASKQQSSSLAANNRPGLDSIPSAAGDATGVARDHAKRVRSKCPSADSGCKTDQWDEDCEDFSVRSVQYGDALGPQKLSDSPKCESGYIDANGTNSAQNAPPHDSSLNKKIRKPKIYFGTRTHKQIGQIVRELRRTEYSNTKMTVLASREHTCVHPQVSRSSNKSEGCRELLDPYNPELSCSYFHRVSHRLRNHDQLSAAGCDGAWQLSELVQLGRKLRVCPYFGSRQLRETADLVFCPYNYLIEPYIRQSMDISLAGQVLILDEAHNIEDCARDAASCQLHLLQLREAVSELERCAAGVRRTRSQCTDMARLLSYICQWMETTIDSDDVGGGDSNNSSSRGGEAAQQVRREFDRVSRVFAGGDMVAQLTSMGAGPDTFPALFESFTAIANEDGESPNSGDNGAPAVDEYGSPLASSVPRLDPSVRVPNSVMSVLGQLFAELGYIYGEGMKHRDEFRLALGKVMAPLKKSAILASTDQDGWIGRVQQHRRSRHKHQPSAIRLSWQLQLQFICLDPSVVFAPLGRTAHSVLVTSGTLHPMCSFQSELGVQFPLRLEARHVIDMNQVMVATLNHGLQGCALNSTYRNSEQFSLQDDIGATLKAVCETVPHGVLCFLSSYSMLDKLVKRWQSTGLWQQLQDIKPTLCEPRGGNSSTNNNNNHNDGIVGGTGGSFDAVMTEFAALTSTTRGACMLAVCRGKLSEGIDFADENARAVVAVGIPYPNVRDIQVELKKSYNTINKHRGLLPGGQWYSVQAYRALNQALGRCIRHRHDWGAVLLLDNRYCRPGGCDGLSRWIRNSVRHFDNCQQLIPELRHFVDCMQHQTEIRQQKEQKQQEVEVITTDSNLASSILADVNKMNSSSSSGAGGGSINNNSNVKTASQSDQELSNSESDDMKQQQHRLPLVSASTDLLTPVCHIADEEERADSPDLFDSPGVLCSPPQTSYFTSVLSSTSGAAVLESASEKRDASSSDQRAGGVGGNTGCLPNRNVVSDLPSSCRVSSRMTPQLSTVTPPSPTCFLGGMRRSAVSGLFRKRAVNLDSSQSDDGAKHDTEKSNVTRCTYTDSNDHMSRGGCWQDDKETNANDTHIRCETDVVGRKKIKDKTAHKMNRDLTSSTGGDKSGAVKPFCNKGGGRRNADKTFCDRGGDRSVGNDLLTDRGGDRRGGNDLLMDRGGDRSGGNNLHTDKGGDRSHVNDLTLDRDIDKRLFVSSDDTGVDLISQANITDYRTGIHQRSKQTCVTPNAPANLSRRLSLTSRQRSTGGVLTAANKRTRGVVFSSCSDEDDS